MESLGQHRKAGLDEQKKQSKNTEDEGRSWQRSLPTQGVSSPKTSPTICLDIPLRDNSAGWSLGTVAKLNPVLSVSPPQAFQNRFVLSKLQTYILLNLHTNTYSLSLAKKDEVVLQVQTV